MKWKTVSLKNKQTFDKLKKKTQITKIRNKSGNISIDYNEIED